VESLRDELDTAREDKNREEQLYRDTLNELDMMKKECGEVTKSRDVRYFFSCQLSFVAGK